MKVLETGRLLLRWLKANDAEFILQLVNDPSWLRYIGNKGVRTLEDAQLYIENGPVEMYARLGHGLYLVEKKATGEAVGICGLISRESLKDVDLGFAFLPEFRGQGYAFESASAIMVHEVRVHGLSRVVAVTSQDNHASARLLEKLGFRFERLVQLTAEAAEVRMYVTVELPGVASTPVSPGLGKGQDQLSKCSGEWG